MANETPTKLDPAAAVKKHITEYIDYLVKCGDLEITEENYHDLSFKLRAAAAKYALEDQHEPQPKTTLDIIGNLYTSAAVRRHLDITQEELDKLVNDHLILKLDDHNKPKGYPAFQFKDGTIDPAIQKIIKTHLDYPSPGKIYCQPWEVAICLTRQSLQHGGYSIIEYLNKYPEKLDEEINNLLLYLDISTALH